MDRDSFWETVRDFGMLALKVLAVLFLLQVLFIAFNFQLRLPFIADWVLYVFGMYQRYVG